MTDSFDAVVIGGGFYGVTIANYLARCTPLTRIALIERESTLLTRASYHNQARVHNGYHYPRSYTTAYRSRINMPKFVADFQSAIKKDFVKLYAIARQNSKVTPKQFVRFCQEINAKIQPADRVFQELFDPRLIEAVYAVEEYAFDANILRDLAKEQLRESKVEIKCNTKVNSITKKSDNNLTVLTDEHQLSCRYVYNCTYSELNQISGDFGGIITGLKHELTEMALLNLPENLKGIGITVMDGPFFSLMPFPPRDLHTLSHVRYTPHLYWKDEIDKSPYQKLSVYNKATHADRMIRDVQRYFPAIQQKQYVDSLFEVKTLLVKNEGDDGRPILFEQNPQLPGCYSVLGGKIDNIFDVLEKLNDQTFI